MKMTRKIFAVAAVAVLAAGASYVTAQGNPGPPAQLQHAIHDTNGDGICDICNQPVGSGLRNGQGRAAMKGYHYGPGGGSGNQGIGPRDGTGYGVRSGQGRGLQNCTGIGMNGARGAGYRGGNRGGGRPRR